MTIDEKVIRLNQAAEMLQNGVDIVAEIFQEDGHVKAYWIDQVSEHIQKSNPYNLDLNDLIEKVKSK